MDHHLTLARPVDGSLRLTSDITLTAPLSIITGKNGSGKTRLLELLHSKRPSIDGNPVESTRKFMHSDLTPKLANTSREHLQNVRRFLLHAYARWRQEGFRNDDPYMPMGEQYNVGDLQLISEKIASRTKKDYKSLSDEDLEDYFPIKTHDYFANFNISERFSHYIFALHANRKNKGLHLGGEKSVQFLEDDQFLAEEGPPPWEELNQILGEIFDNKFRCLFPDPTSRQYDYVFTLFEGDAPRSFEELSTGEQTLLWLALVLFNASKEKNRVADSKRLFLFDEPDAFLHPQMVAQMFKTFSAFSARFNICIVLTTHSPTTVAQAPGDSLYRISENQILPISTDEAIADLLEGVPHISLDPQKRRQVYVESFYDAEAYQFAFDYTKSKHRLLDPSISLSFIASGDRIPIENIKQALDKHLPNASKEEIAAVTAALNGIGDCSKVVAQVESIINAGSKTVCGVLDWDTQNSTNKEKKIFTLGENVFYSLENWALDPNACLFALHKIDPNRFPLSTTVKNLDITDWLSSRGHMQASLDMMILKIYGSENQRDAPVEYANGMQLDSDARHTARQGHKHVETAIVKAFPELIPLARSHRLKSLKLAVMEEFMIFKTEGAFIPLEVVKTLAAIQAS